ncbi:hypothetical protein ACFSRY_04110 [Pontibacter locisalis]|uniref:Uncharacterized protein n=1 Tax=Pontibacter locisalis TaxID=1719035 RepID=A0ABW5IHC7_9BACT
MHHVKPHTPDHRGSQIENQSGIICDLKKHTSKTILKAIADNPQESRREWMLSMFEWAGKQNTNNKNYQFWEQHNQPIELNTTLLMETRGRKLLLQH